MVKPTHYSDQKNWSNTYLTDPNLIRFLGPFATDPCCPPDMPWRTATTMYHEGEDDGLVDTWRGRVFMNPPYRGVLQWAARFAAHRNGIALLNGRSTETRATQLIMDRSSAIWFPSGRLTFFRPTGKPFEQKWFPSLLIGMTDRDRRSMERAREEYGGVIYAKG